MAGYYGPGTVQRMVGGHYQDQAASAAPVAAAVPAPPPETPVSDVSNEQARQIRELEKQLAIEQAKRAAQAKAFGRDTSRVMGGQESFQTGGVAAFEAQQALAGLLGPEAQQAAIAQLEASPEFGAMLQQGERGILANAAATGGVRGGNTAGALAQFRPQLLSSIIQQQYARLGGMSGLGAQAGQGLMGASLSREQQAEANALGLLGQSTQLGLGASAAEAGGKLGQIQYDLGLAAAEEDRERFQRMMDQQMALGLFGGVTGMLGNIPIPGKIG